MGPLLGTGVARRSPGAGSLNSLRGLKHPNAGKEGPGSPGAGSLNSLRGLKHPNAGKEGPGSPWVTYSG